MSSPYNSLFTQFGLPSESPIEYLERKRKAAYEARRATYAPNMTTRSGILGNLGHQIGSIIASRGEEVTESEQAKLDAAALARNRFEALANSGELHGASYREKANSFQAILADAAFEKGLHGIGAMAANDLYEKKHKQATQKLQLRQLEQNVDNNDWLETLRPVKEAQARATLEQTNESIANTRDARLRNKLVDVWPVGSNNPNSTIPAILHTDGSMTTRSGQPLDPDKFTTTKPTAPRAATSSSSYIPPKDRTKIIDQVDATGSQIRATNEIIRTLAGAVTADGSINIMDGAGSVVGKINKLEQNLRAISRSVMGEEYIDNVPVRDKSGNIVNPSEIIAQANEYQSLINTKTGRDRAKYEALMLRLTMAQARANEPGARSYTEADVQRAASMVGSALVDPESFRQVAVSNVRNAINSLQTKLGSYNPEERAGIVYEDALKLLYGSKATSGIDDPKAEGYVYGWLDELNDLTDGMYYGTAGEVNSDLSSIPPDPGGAVTPDVVSDRNTNYDPNAPTTAQPTESSTGVAVPETPSEELDRRVDDAQFREWDEMY